MSKESNEITQDERRFLNQLSNAFPRIAAALERIAAAMERHLYNGKGGAYAQDCKRTKSRSDSGTKKEASPC